MEKERKKCQMESGNKNERRQEMEKGWQRNELYQNGKIDLITDIQFSSLIKWIIIFKGINPQNETIYKKVEQESKHNRLAKV